MRNAILIATLVCLALSPLHVTAKDPAVSEAINYDIGLNPTIPEGKADTLVVYSATWCGPCQAMRPTWVALRAEGYKVVYVDVDEPHKYDGRWPYQTAELVDRVTQYEPRAVPTVRWYNSVTNEFLPDKVTGLTDRDRVKTHLWRPDDSDTDRRPLRRIFDRPAVHR